MTFTPEQIKALEAPLYAGNVKRRSQAGRSLDYIEAWWAISEANRIFGFDAWTRETVEMRCVQEKPTVIGKGKSYEKPGFVVSYIAKVRVTVDGILKEGTGAGHGIDADLGQAHESAAKEAESDGMKRALMMFGNPFGLALYDKDKANVSPLTGDDAEELAVRTGERFADGITKSFRAAEAARGGRQSAAASKPQWNGFLTKLKSFTDPDECGRWFDSAETQGKINSWPKGDAGDWAELAADEFDQHIRTLYHGKAAE